MNRNLFEVGEVVILQSVTMRHLNGEYLVNNFQYSNYRHCWVTGRPLSGGFVYELESIEIPFDESALRKKHKGSEMRYNEMIKSLNVDIVEVV